MVLNVVCSFVKGEGLLPSDAPQGACTDVCWQTRMFLQLTRLETRTKEFITACASSWVGNTFHMRNESDWLGCKLCTSSRLRFFRREV